MAKQAAEAAFAQALNDAAWKAANPKRDDALQIEAEIEAQMAKQAAEAALAQALNDAAWKTANSP